MGLDFDRLSTRLSLRGRDLGGMPLSLRVRARSQRLERSRDFGRGATESETRDRLDEFAVRDEAPSDRFAVIGASYALISGTPSLTASGGKFYFLAPGDRYNLATREATRASATQSPVQGVQKKPWGGGDR